MGNRLAERGMVASLLRSECLFIMVVYLFLIFFEMASDVAQACPVLCNWG